MRYIVENIMSKEFEVLGIAYDRDDIKDLGLKGYVEQFDNSWFEEYIDEDYGTVFFVNGNNIEEFNIDYEKVVDIMREVLANEIGYEEVWDMSNEEIYNYVEENRTRLFFKYQ